MSCSGKAVLTKTVKCLGLPPEGFKDYNDALPRRCFWSSQTWTMRRHSPPTQLAANSSRKTVRCTSTGAGSIICGR